MSLFLTLVFPQYPPQRESVNCCCFSQNPLCFMGSSLEWWKGMRNGEDSKPSQQFSIFWGDCVLGLRPLQVFLFPYLLPPSLAAIVFSTCFLEGLILVDYLFPPHRWAGNVEAGWSGRHSLPSSWMAPAKLFWRVGFCNGEDFWYISKWLIIPSCGQSQEGIFLGSLACEPGTIPGTKVQKSLGPAKIVAPRSFSLSGKSTLSLQQSDKITCWEFLPVYDPRGFCSR